MIDVSIIIVNWNTKEYLLRCVGAVSRARKYISSEVIVVDNGSVDGSTTAVRERFPEITLIENRINLGFAKGNNQALRQSKGRYLLLLNPDTRIEGGTIQRLVSFLDGHPDAGGAGGQLLHSDGSKQNSIANFPSLSTELLNKNLLRWLFPKRFPGKERTYSEPIEVESVIGACMMVRRDVVNQVGWLDEDYFLFLEETDWCFRMKRAGWKIYHHPRAELYHFQGKSAASEKKRAKVEYYRSRYIFFKKNRGKVQWLVLVLGTVLRLSVEVISAAVICVLTLFRLRRWKQKLSTFAYVMWWHLRFCPEDMGLKTKQ